MSIETLSDWVVHQKWFISDLTNLTKTSISNDMPNLSESINILDFTVDLPRMLFAASILAHSENPEHNSDALKVAVACLKMHSEETNIRDAAALILDNLDNRRTLSLAENNGLIEENITDRMGVLPKLAWAKNSFEQEIQTSSSVFYANRFQLNTWERLNSFDWVSISAPTSAGKSFIALEWLFDSISGSHGGNYIYLAPTRALVSEIEKKCQSLKKKFNLSNNLNILTVPSFEDIETEKANLFIFTQERLHLLLNHSMGEFKVEQLVVDEVQKVSDGSRGALLEQAIERVVSECDLKKAILLSPETENLEILSDDAPNTSTTSELVSSHGVVVQNLIYANKVKGKSISWELTSIGKEDTSLGTISLAGEPSTIVKKMGFISCAVGADLGGNLVYANTASEAQNIAKLISSIQTSKFDATSGLVELGKLIKKVIHPKFLLADYVIAGVAFHYGNMPQLVREEIERNFEIGELKFLVCTSTLIEGVNLSCRNIFVRAPRKGQGNPMSMQDFWNLAGRAGRWGTDFQGNVICIDTNNRSQWKNGIPKEKVKSPIKKVSYQVLEKTDLLASFLEDGMPRKVANDEPQLETIGSYLLIKSLEENLEGVAAYERLEPEKKIALSTALSGLSSSITLPLELLKKHPEVSGLALQKLYNYFKKKIEDDSRDPLDFIPPSPYADDAATHFTYIYLRLHKLLLPKFGTFKRCMALSIVTVNWMKGMPLRRIIQSRIDHEKETDVIKIQGIIRRVMADIEEYARFLAPKYFSAYLTVLKYYFEEKGIGNLLDDNYQFELLLEYGVPSGTLLSLIKLGISRSSAMELFDAEIIDSNMDKHQVAKWLQAFDLEKADLPTAIKTEVRIVQSELLG